ncbi:hypothetical protein DPMN_159485 [Dreissena polymorpha]|uniref:Uncharacterized protein n=1 Tax=Dreissena polymorpha TaxID=45954 RepID=A0A9D4ENC1_DREPO|nr:hypothetical protein DPMN_159485 [Dreissena polymorpha]
MSKQLNRMLKRLTLLDRFIVPGELTQNAVGNYKNTEDANVAERKVGIMMKVFRFRLSNNVKEGGHLSHSVYLYDCINGLKFVEGILSFNHMFQPILM